MAKSSRISEDALLKHLQGQRPPAQRADTGGMILHTPPTGPSLSLEQMLAAESAAESAAAPVAPSAAPSPVSATDSGAAAASAAVAFDTVVTLDLARVDDSPYQSTADAGNRYDPESIDELAHTMATAGQEEPILVRPVGSRYELIAGHRRVRAARTLGWSTIRALVVQRGDREAHQSVLVHNEGRKDLCDYGKAKVYQRAKSESFVTTQDEIARMFATRQSHVSQRLAMLKLPAPILAMLEEQNDLFSMTTAANILALLKEYPDEEALLTQAVLRLKADNAPENSVRPWFLQVLQARLRPQRAARRRPKVVTDPAGRPLYTAALDGRVITVRLSAQDIDGDALLEKMVEFLKTNSADSE